MSFSSDMKKELALIIPEKKCDMLAEIAGFVRMNGSIGLIGGGRMSVSVSSEDPAIARLMKKLITQYFDTDTSLEIISGSGLRKAKHYRLTFRDVILGEQMLRETGLLVVQEGSNVLTDGVPSDIVRKKCCKRAYLRGLFLAAGSVNNPEKGYHLEITGGDRVTANDIRKLMNSFGLNAKVAERREQSVVYLKESEKIIDFMNIVGANKQLFKVENVRIIKEMRNAANRIVNCESANVDKTVNAAQRQLQDIQLVEKRIGLDKLPPKLRAAAEARLENPELPLKELADVLQPPVSKSGLNHRLARIGELAERLREEPGAE